MKREIREKTGYKNRDFVFKNYVWGIRFYSEDNMKMVKDFVCFCLEVTRCSRGFPCSSAELACRCRRYKKHGFNTWVRKIPWWWAWQLTPVFLPGESHGQKSWCATVHVVTGSQLDGLECTHTWMHWKFSSTRAEQIVLAWLWWIQTGLEETCRKTQQGRW